ncbi:MAG: glycosyltransferase [Planctomycetes bacterium]|nr:glycosyltransferase [Planctomycetota bacterium]
MKVSGFTFLRNGELFGYPFIESIKSALPLCDEFIIALGPCEDDTRAMLEGIGDDKIKIIDTEWNEVMSDRGFVYGQQKMIAHYNCTGDWAFYIEGDEVLHEDDLPAIEASMENHLHDNEVEALVFDYLHFYGNYQTYAWSPGWYRRAPRIIKNNIRVYSPDGLFFVVLDKNKKGRYPKAALANATMYHYGWVRPEEAMKIKDQKVARYWNENPRETKYDNIYQGFLRKFEKSHPKVMAECIGSDDIDIFQANPQYKVTKRDKRHLRQMKIEGLLGIDTCKKHFNLVH